MTLSVAVVLAAVIVFALGLLTLAWSPRPHESAEGPISHRHYPKPSPSSPCGQRSSSAPSSAACLRSLS
jgi:hypothetical protein